MECDFSELPISARSCHADKLTSGHPNPYQININEDKTKYLIFSSSNTEVSTRLSVNCRILERIEVVGVWLTKRIMHLKSARKRMSGFPQP